MRRAVVGAVALCLIGGTAARAQGADDLGSLLAVIQEHFGQSMGEAVLGGQSVFVTAKGAVKLQGLPKRAYELTVEAQGPTAAQAAKLRDDKVEKLREVASRFSAPITVGEPSYVANRAIIAPRINLPAGTPPVVTVPSPNGPALPAGAAAAGQVTARVPVQFTRPPPAQMPAFLDALREAGVDTLPDTNVAANPLAQLTQILGLGLGAPAAGTADEEAWGRASTAAMQAARAEAEALAAPAGRHVGAVRQVMLLSRSVQNDEATVSVAVRFGFAPEK
jgi:hypothetical protein